jgi:hypothetical protein
MLLFLVLIAPISGQIEPDGIPPVPEGFALSAVDAIDRYGPPDLSLGSLLAYRTVFASLQADVSLLVLGDAVDEILFSFDAGSATLRSDADRVLKRLRVLYGPPTTYLRSPDQKTHRWERLEGELVHTVVFTPGREQHFIRTARARGPGN